MTLLKETLEVLKENGYSEKDIQFIGTQKNQITLDNFKAIANVEYDSGFGASEVADNLVIVGNDFYMTRGEYDGSEWWDFHKKPSYLNIPFVEIKALTVDQAEENGMNVSCGWNSLERLNGLPE